MVKICDFFLKKETDMIPWEQAVRIFVFGFSGVFITLAILVLTILILGKVMSLFKKPKPSV
jgi:Na+-transporting methylmalonyl-CoA/oxaloacetate decarboxylase gamma subunit